MSPDVVVLTLAEYPERLAGFRQRHGELGRPYVGRLDLPWAGCRDGHRSIWQQMTRDTLVLEDDAVLAPHWRQALDQAALPTDWDLLYLGGQHLGRPVPAGPGLLRCGGTHRTHAYLARHSSVPRLLAATDVDDHLDAALASAQATGALTAYALSPWVAGQAAGRSAISRRREDERWWGPAPRW